MGRILDGMVVAVGLAAVLVVGMLVKRQFFASSTSAARAQGNARLEIEPPDWARLRTVVTWLGPADRPVQVIEFADFQCPFCARLNSPLAELRQLHGDSVAFGFAHFPLRQIHPYAYEAALSAVCADRQGHFVPMADALYAHQEAFGEVSFDSLARLAGISDRSKFDRCLRDSGTRGVVDSDLAWASRLTLDGTPTVYVNGRLIPPQGDPAYVRRAVETILSSR